MTMRNDLSGCLLLLALTACDDKGEKTDVRPEAVGPSASATTASTALPPEPEEPPPPPTLGRVALEHDELTGAVALHTIANAVMLSAGANVYRLTDDGGVEMAGTIPRKDSMWGPNEIREVFGRWPTLLGVEYRSPFGRAPQPTYAPLKGGGGWYTLAEGGGMGMIYGIAHHGETTTLYGYDMYEGYRIIKVRGPLEKPALTPREALDCPKEEYPQLNPGVKPAIRPAGYGATRKGTVISIGTHCEGYTAAEVWKEIPGKGELVSLKSWDHGGVWGVLLLQGPGDTLYVDGDSTKPLLRYRDGDFSPLPSVPGGRALAFVSSDGRLFATSDRRLYAWAEDSWKHLADLAFPADYTAMASLGDRFVATHYGTLYELKSTEPTHLDPGADEVACATPFIHLFDARLETPKHYRFPQTAAKMATFDQLEQVELVDYQAGQQRVGLKAKTWAAAKAAWKHVAETMPDEKPMMLCYDPPEPRVVTVVAKPAPTKPPGAKPPAKKETPSPSAAPTPSGP